MKKILIAIDGFSSTGKSTLAKQLAKKLHYEYIDSGAMYRAITLFFLRHHVDIAKSEHVEHALSDIHLHFENHQIYLNGEQVEQAIRQMDVSNFVSEVAALSSVRENAVKQQQKLGLKKGLVMDGRDIGTTVFPNAELKIYLCADEPIRVTRRYEEMKQKNANISVDEVKANLRHRDLIDSTREISPLRKADDAVVLDNSQLTMSQQLQIAYDMAMQLINS
ncbi:MAG: (d)CMP kinase [Chitinophagaceae bacterium]